MVKISEIVMVKIRQNPSIVAEGSWEKLSLELLWPKDSH